MGHFVFILIAGPSTPIPSQVVNYIYRRQDKAYLKLMLMAG